MSPSDHGEHVADVLTAPELDAMATIKRTLGFDILRTYQCWEAVVALLTEGTLTPRGCAWDVDVTVPRTVRPVRVEVKFSDEFTMSFGTGARQVFKFAAPRGEGATKASDVTVLIGIDSGDRVHAWVAPSALLRQSASITLTTPGTRVGAGRSAVERYQVPFTQLLPEILRAAGTVAAQPLLPIDEETT